MTVYLKIIFLIVFCLLLFFCFSYLGLTELSDGILKAYIVAIGGFIGAYSAFMLKRFEDIKITKEKRILSINIALFTMIQQINYIMMLKNSFNDFDGEFKRAFSMPAIKIPDGSNLKIDLDSLYFIIDNDNINLLLELAVEQSRFEQVIVAFEIRREFHETELQEQFSKHKITDRDISKEEIKRLIGDKVYYKAISCANAMHSHTNATEKSLLKKLTDLRSYAKKIFPDGKFTNIEIPK